MSTEEVETLARAWMDAVNRGDVPAVVSLYAETATHTSPRLRSLQPETGGLLVGRAALSSWWTWSLQRLPGLRYELVSITASPGRAFVEYVRHAPNQAPQPIAQAIEVQGGRIVASRVYHG
jgi:hypothetical protein